MLLASRISSLGGLVAAAVAPIAAAFLGQTHLVILLVACSLIVFWKHRENIQRLMAGTEPQNRPEIRRRGGWPKAMSLQGCG